MTYVTVNRLSNLPGFLLPVICDTLVAFCTAVIIILDVSQSNNVYSELKFVNIDQFVYTGASFALSELNIFMPFCVFQRP